MSHAIDAATAMCGDFREGLRLAVGGPLRLADRARDDWTDDESPLTAEEIAEVYRREERVSARLAQSALAARASAYCHDAFRWLYRHVKTLKGDDVLEEAVRIVDHDLGHIRSQVQTALASRFGHEESGGAAHNPIRWDGAAKSALICIERSEHAWRAIAEATGEQTPGVLAEQLRDLRQLVEAEFPHAWQFVRPGFDEPGR